jgi:hypothetical protein
MRILMIAENDPAGTSILFSDAINAYTEHSCRLITTKEKYCFQFKKDIHLPDIQNYPVEQYEEAIREIEDLLINSDIFHYQVLADDETQIGPFKPKDFLKGKKITHEHHGSPPFRANPDKYRQKYKKLNRKVLVSTPDLLLGLPEAYWMPNLLPINNPEYMPTEERYPEFTIGHSPTRLALKNTSELIYAANRAGVNVDIIMNTSLSGCLKRKQKSHAIFDHLQGYYSVSSLEGLSMGKPVIANLSDWVSVNIKEFAETEYLPWDKASGVDDVVDLFEWYSLGASSGGRKFMENHWYPEKIVTRLIKFYEGL